MARKNEKRLSEIAQMCSEHDLEWFEGKLREIDRYFSERAKTDWPKMKTEIDIKLEYAVRPFVVDCIEYIKNEKGDH